MINHRQITQILVFHLKENRWWAFKQMGLASTNLKKTKGLDFFKLLGTGGREGFSLRPDFSTYVFLGVWQSEKFAQHFVDHHQFIQNYKARCYTIREITLQSFQSHGLWNGTNPFMDADPPNSSQKVAIITRASLRWSRLGSFWRSVPQASRAIEQATGVEYFKGIGEWPFVQQATLSIWDSLEQVKQFAYKTKAHADIVKKARQKKWYKEDLFARFVVINQKTI